MRRVLAAALIATVAGALSPPATAQGLLIATATQPATQDIDGCVKSAQKALSGTGTVIEVGAVSVFGSNEERTITIRCDLPSTVLFIEGLFPGDKDHLDDIQAAFTKRVSAALIASVSKSHQYSVDCPRGTSCEIDPVKVCQQAYATSAKPAAKVLTRQLCADAQGSYTCGVAYDLNCS